jgi:glycosyltransferase involved in cell wall biosynthesis
MRVAVVVQGRFHAFDLARALLARGHDVWLFTNYPGWVVRRFHFPAERVHSFVLHGVLSRIIYRIERWTGLRLGEAVLHRMFGRWAAWKVTRERWDVVHVWSSVAEELLRKLEGTGTSTWLLRASTHIRAQSELLEAEERRAGVRLDKPSRWMIAREEREYQMATRVLLLSRFAERTFIKQGVDPKRLVRIPLTASEQDFRPQVEVVEQRIARIVSGQPLRLLFVGSMLFRKGLLDLIEIGRNLPSGRFEGRLVGTLTAEVRHVLPELEKWWQVLGHKPQSSLPQHYAWADLFIFPTIEDGFAVVLAQAHAGGVPVIATTNCAALDIVQDGRNGWVLPIRSPDSFVEKLLWADRHRDQLAEMVRYTYSGYRKRSWSDVAEEFERK